MRKIGSAIPLCVLHGRDQTHLGAGVPLGSALLYAVITCISALGS